MSETQISFDKLFFSEPKSEINEVVSPSPLQQNIIELLQSNVTSTLEICECLIGSGKLSKERYSSNKPKEYPKICAILDEMVRQGNVLFIEDKNKKDRIYQLKEC